MGLQAGMHLPACLRRTGRGAAMQSVILGTAQWGLDYGVTNAAGRLSDEAVREIADCA